MRGFSDLGLHKIGLFAARRFWTALLAFLLIIALAGLGLSRLTTEASLTKAFHAGTPEHEVYLKLISTFPGSEHDLLVVVRADKIFTTENLSALQELHFELPLVDHVSSIASIFSLRRSVITGADPPPLLPEDIPDNAEELKALEAMVLNHPLSHQRLLSPRFEDGQLTLLFLSLDPKFDNADLRKALIEEARRIIGDFLKPTGMTFQIGGVPMARQELLNATRSDSRLITALGFLVGLIIGAIVFRRWQFILVAALCPLLAIAGGVGAIGLFGGVYGPFMTGIPPLIMAVAFTDCMHILFAVRARMTEGSSSTDALVLALQDVGPACAIASLTTAAALLSLTLAPSPLVREFGFWAASAAMIAVVIVFLALPLLSRIALKSLEGARFEGKRDIFIGLSDLCRSIGERVYGHQKAIVWTGLALTILVTSAYYALEPRYRLSEQVPINGEFRPVNEALDRSLGGSAPVYVLVRWKPEKPPPDHRLIQAIAGAHQNLKSAVADRSVSSVLSLGRGFSGTPDATDDQMQKALTLFDDATESRLFSRKHGGALVTVLLPDLNAGDIAAVASKIDRAMLPLRGKFPELEFVVTGLPVLLAVGSPSLIAQINKSLLAAFVIVIVMLGVMFKSWQVGAMSLIPNILPVFAAACAIYLIAGGLEYASVVALTVGFGLAVDDTTHFFNRLRLETAQSDSLNTAVVDALGRVGPVLIVTTVVLVCGLAVTVFGEVRTAFLFGVSCIAILVGALIADLVVLPAILFASTRVKVLQLWDKKS